MKRRRDKRLYIENVRQLLLEYCRTILTSVVLLAVTMFFFAMAHFIGQQNGYPSWLRYGVEFIAVMMLILNGILVLGTATILTFRVLHEMLVSLSKRSEEEEDEK